MLFLFGINLKKQKNLKIHTQERKVATYTSTNLKSRCFFFFFQQWHMELPAHSFWGKKWKNGNGKGLPGWPYQSEDDYKGARGTWYTNPLLYVTLHLFVHSWNCKTKPFSEYSSPTEPDQISPAMNRKECT